MFDHQHDATASPPVDEARAAGERIEVLLEASTSGGPAVRARAEELVACVSGLYGAGLRHLLDILQDRNLLDAALLEAFAADDLVASLLLVHDLHPHDTRTRVSRALDTVRPYLGSHGGDVELLDIHDGVVRLRLLGSCDGCPSSAVTLELAVTQAIEAAAPEVSKIQVVTDSAVPTSAPAGSVFSIDSLRSRIDRPPAAESGQWVDLPELATLTPGELAGFEIGGLAVCACRLGADVFCFRDRCAHCQQSLAGGIVERRLGDPIGTGVLRCPRCRSHYDIRRAGAGLDDTSEHLDPLPVLVRNGVTQIAVPAVVGS